MVLGELKGIRWLLTDLKRDRLINQSLESLNKLNGFIELQEKFTIFLGLLAGVTEGYRDEDLTVCGKHLEPKSPHIPIGQGILCKACRKKLLFNDILNAQAKREERDNLYTLTPPLKGTYVI